MASDLQASFETTGKLKRAAQNSGPTGKTGPNNKMQTQVKIPKPRGRLSRYVQTRIGDTLRAAYDEIVREGVPERFAKLIDQIEGGQRDVARGDSGQHFTNSGDTDATANKGGSQVGTEGADRPIVETGDKGSV